MTFTSADPSANNVPTFGYGDYLRFSKLVYGRCGLHFPDNRRSDLERGVRQAYAASTCKDMNEYYRLLQDPNSSAVYFERLANALTISETHFFRDSGQIDALYNHVLPQIINRRRSLRTLRIWSAGCASGEEPYSIAMLLRELLPNVEDWSITILGTDINTEAIDRARQAIYSEWAFREERAKTWRSRYFRRRGNRYELIPEVKRMVTFGQLNLMEDNYPSYESNTTLMDLVMCRNVMIYFTETISRSVVDRFYACLTYGGWLVVGHAEHSLSIYRKFQIHNFPNAILYQRTDEPQPQPQEWKWLGEPVETSAPALLAPPPQQAAFPVTLEEAGADTAAPTQAERRAQLLDSGTKPRPERELDHVYIYSLGRLGHVDPMERARELLAYGRSEDARDLLVQMVRAGAREAPVYALLGQAYANLGKWDDSERWCREAIRLDKLALDAYYILALVLQHQGDLDEAIDVMKKVVYIDRLYVLGHFGLADLYYNSNLLPLALKSLDNARRLLEGVPDNEFIPGSGGITVGSLRGVIIHQQQMWRAEGADL
ncbi:MAG TPA: tetratricopeptide repeat protein [Chloroflexi bacterium]|nr:tetratricopeptide repeat protein [Chloroflexota bacterium]